MAMRRILLAIGLALIPAIAHAAEKPFTETTPGPEAWWLRTEYHPFDKEVRGVSVAKIRANWCKANEFRKDLFPKELAASLEGRKSPFAADGFFDGSNTRQTALVGAYETCAGKHGVFFLIMSRPEGKPAEISFIREFPGKREFAALEALEDGAIVVFHCLECDSATQFRWRRAKQQFVRVPVKDGD